MTKKLTCTITIGVSDEITSEDIKMLESNIDFALETERQMGTLSTNFEDSESSVDWLGVDSITVKE